MWEIFKSKKRKEQEAQYLAERKEAFEAYCKQTTKQFDEWNDMGRKGGHRPDNRYLFEKKIKYRFKMYPRSDEYLCIEKFEYKGKTYTFGWDYDTIAICSLTGEYCAKIKVGGGLYSDAYTRDCRICNMVEEKDLNKH